MSQAKVKTEDIPVDDDIDLLKYLFLVWRNKWLVVIGLALGIGIGTFHNSRLSDVYSGYITFIIPGAAQSDSNNALGRYASLLGAAPTSSKPEFAALIGSNRLNKEISVTLKSRNQPRSVGSLALEALDAGLLKLTNENTNKEAIAPVLKAAFTSVEKLNKEFRLTGSRIEWVLIDGPVVQSKPIRPDKKKNIVIFGFAGMLVAILTILGIQQWKIIRTEYTKYEVN